MPELKLNKKLRDTLDDFVQRLQEACKENLISVILYGSAASGEYVDRHSNLNLLVVLKSSDLEDLMSISGLINKWKFRMIHPLFLSENYIRNSTDIFPIEFLDMKENYTVLWGKDIFKDLSIDTRNLRFQCEQELKIKLIALRQFYLRKSKDRAALSLFLFKSFNSVMHILRNVLRTKGKQAPYLKQDILKEISSEFMIDKNVWEKILAAKNKKIKLGLNETQLVFMGFVRDLEKIIDAVDKL
jgi:predicted nucleotidyltransferase